MDKGCGGCSRMKERMKAGETCIDCNTVECNNEPAKREFGYCRNHLYHFLSQC